MRAEAKAGAVADADHLPLADLLADRDGDRLLVGVAGGDPATVVEAGVVAVARLRTRDRDGAGGGGLDRRAARDADVDAGVTALPGARLAERRGDRAVHGPDHPGGALALDRPGRGGGRSRRRGGLRLGRGLRRLGLLLGLKL